MLAMAVSPSQRLEISALSARAGGRDVLSAISLEVATGEIVAIVGSKADSQVLFDELRVERL
jgi:ABC-type histidine transport system ATPase subunit